MKKLFANLCTLAFISAVAAAEVIQIENFAHSHTPVLIPAVQKHVPYLGVVELPDVLTVSVPKGEELIVEQLAGEMKRFGRTAKAADENAYVRFELTEDGVPENPQGYTLDVYLQRKGITIRSRSTDGLYFGAQTLRNMLRNAPIPKGENPQLELCRITDWPDFDRRGYFFSMAGRTRQSLPNLKKMLDAFSQLKINWIMLDLGHSFPFKNNPLTLRENSLTEDDVRTIIKWCKERHIEITPTIQFWSHAQWMTYHPDWDKMKEGEPARRWVSQPCPECKEPYELLRMSVNEHIDLFKPRALFLMMDEFYLGPFNKCPKCKGKNTFEQFARIVKFGEDLCLERGVTPLVCHDSFLDYPFLGWNFGTKLLKRLNPKTRVVFWDYGDRINEEIMVKFREHGIIGHSVNGKPLNVINMARLVKKHGGRESTMVYWYYSNGGLIADLKHETPESLGGLVIGADALWKFDDRYYGSYAYDAVLEMMRLLHPERVRDRLTMGVGTPIPLDAYFNTELSGTKGKFPRFANDDQTEALKKALAESAEQFELVTAPGGRYYAVRLTGDKKNGGRHAVMIKLDDVKAKAFSFLLTSSRPYDGLAFAGARFYGTKRFTHPVVGAIDLCYSDGTKVRTLLRYRESITDWNRAFSGTDMRFAVRGVDADKRYYSFGVFDLVNPHPEKPIRGILFSSAKQEGLSPALLAASAYGADKSFARGKKFAPAMLKGRPPVIDLPRNGCEIVADFENGMGDVEVFTPPSIKAKMKVAVINDPTAPTPGKVLKITIPPGEYRGRSADLGYLRVSVDIKGYAVPAGTGGITSDVKLCLNGGTGFSHANDYVIESWSPEVRNPKFRSQRIFGPFGYAQLEGIWQRISLPFNLSRFKGSPNLGDVTKTQYRRLSFFFKRIDAPAEIYVDNIGNLKKGFSDAPPWTIEQEADPL